MSLLSRRRRRWHSNAGHGQYQMSYEDPTRPLADAQGSYRTLSSSQADRRTRTLTRSLPGLFREPHTCSLFRHRATYMAFASVRYAWVSVHSVRFVSTGSGEGSSLGQVLHTRFLAFVITHHIRCLYHSHFPPTASIPSHCTFIYHSLGRRRHHFNWMKTYHQRRLRIQTLRFEHRLFRHPSHWSITRPIAQ